MTATDYMMPKWLVKSVSSSGTNLEVLVCLMVICHS